jgi:HEPN domain-containing protein
LQSKALQMIDINKQITYWQTGAADDLESAKILIDNNRLLHGLFLCHLVVEKSLKAIVVKETNEIAPRSHNLLYLSEMAKLEFEELDEIFLGILMKYQLQGRYPDYNPLVPNIDKTREYLYKTEKFMLWLQTK